MNVRARNGPVAARAALGIGCAPLSARPLQRRVVRVAGIADRLEHIEVEELVRVAEHRDLVVNLDRTDRPVAEPQAAFT